MRQGESDADERSVRAALIAHVRTRPLAGAALEPLAGGLGNRTWRVGAGDGNRYVVRLNARDSSVLGIDRHSEAALIDAAAAAGIAPPIVLCDVSRGLLVTRLVEGNAWTRDDARSPRNLERLAQTLTRLHALSPVPDVAPRSFRAQARHLESALTERGLPHDADLARTANETFDRLEHSAGPQTLCHNDIHHLNVIDDGKQLTLVDWEYGGRGDPRFDLAAFVSYHGLDVARREVLLNGYRGPAPVAQLDDATWAFDYVQWLWYRVARETAERRTDTVMGERAATLRLRLQRD